MSNSLKFTDENGCITIDIRILDHQPQEEEVESENDQPLIFDDLSDENLDEQILRSIKDRTKKKDEPCIN